MAFAAGKAPEFYLRGAFVEVEIVDLAELLFQLGEESFVDSDGLVFSEGFDSE